MHITLTDANVKYKLGWESHEKLEMINKYFWMIFLLNKLVDTEYYLTIDYLEEHLQ